MNMNGFELEKELKRIDRKLKRKNISYREGRILLEKKKELLKLQHGRKLFENHAREFLIKNGFSKEIVEEMKFEWSDPIERR